MIPLHRALVISIFTITTAFAAAAQTRPTVSPRPTTSPRSATTTATTNLKRVCVIFSSNFDNPEQGIKKMVDAKRSIDAIFKADLDGLSAAFAKLQTLERESISLQEQLRAPNITAAEASRIQAILSAKENEFDALGREHNFKRDQLRTAYDAKQKEVLGPIIVEIGKAAAEFAKLRGYSVILDGSRMTQNGMIIGLDDTMNLTKDFITFFNSKTSTPTSK